MPPPRDRHSFKFKSIDVLSKLENSIILYNAKRNEQLGLSIINSIAYITHDYPIQSVEYVINESLKISKTGRRVDITSLAIKKSKKIIFTQSDYDSLCTHCLNI